jgi:hypothetical protein
MTPTTRFRYVERDSYEHNGEHFIHPHRVRILQQWWENQNVVLAVLRVGSNGFPQNQYAGEWRDIPLEKEE